MTNQPNILWICSDQQRYDTIHSLGNSRIRTPHIDKLIEHGVSFTEAYCQSPVCSPSRASFLTGRYPRTTRCRQNGQTIPADERLLPRIFADAGYRCGLAGKLHLSSCSDGKVEERIDDGYEVFHWSHHPQPDWAENAYTQWLTKHGVTWEELNRPTDSKFVSIGPPAKYHQTAWCAEMAIDFINEAVTGEHAERPWFFSVNMFDPHHPFDPPEEYLKKYDPKQMPLPKYKPGELDDKPHYQQLDHVWAHNTLNGMRVDEITPQESQEMTAAYYAMVELIDNQVGRMIQALEATGQLESTIVIYMSDHGEMLGDHGLYLKGPHFYDEAVHVPLVIRWPQKLKQNLRSDALVELIDIAPTLCELSGVPIEPQFQGKSLTSICDGSADPHQHRDSVYCEYTNSWTHHRSYGTMYRSRTHKLVTYHGVDAGEFYDLSKDPDEFRNLWNEPTAQSLKLLLMKQAFDASVLTMDPLPERRGPF